MKLVMLMLGLMLGAAAATVYNADDGKQFVARIQECLSD